jgi:hypothetical protein
MPREITQDMVKNHRPLYVIASEIRQHWSPVHVYAKPYVDAMRHVTTLRDSYGADTALSIVLYFLANAQRWHGAEARRIKAELKQMCKDAGYKL